MKYTVLLAWRYLAHHKVRTAVLVLCIALTFFLPVAVSVLVGHYENVLVRRAHSVPLVVGAKGSRYDLLLSALYFKGRMRERIHAGELDVLRDGGLGVPVPLLLEDTARKHPLVGTTLDYFPRMGLHVASGSLPLSLGDAVLGAGVARAHDLGPGDTILTDTRHLYDISAGYPLLLRVRGVLAPAGTPDDGAVFVDVKTAWIVQGIGHGHQDVAAEVDEAAVLERRDGQVVVDSSVKQYREITDDNLGAFHFHGDRTGYPLTAILLWPEGDKASTILKGRYAVSTSAQALVPVDVVEELLGFVFKMKRFFDANVVLVSIATGLFLALIVLLTLRIRQREMETLFKIGCSRGTVFMLQATELTIVLAAGLLLALALAGLTSWYVVDARWIL